MVKLFGLAAVAAAASLALGSAAHATTNLVVDGDFTDLSSGLGQLGYNTNAVGWSIPKNTIGYNLVMTNGATGTAGQYGKITLWTQANGGVNSWNGLAAVSGNFAALDGDYEVEPISQSITGLKAGETYNLSFYYAFGQQQNDTGATQQSLTWSLGGVKEGSATDSLASKGFDGWYHFDQTITATSSSETLSFLAKGNSAPPFALLSDVSLTSAVPEPATWAMMILGVAGLGLALRTRRRNVALA